MKGNYSQSLHLSERRVYDYLCHLRDNNAAPSTGQAFIESVNFLSHLVGFVAFDASTLLSPRVKGVVHPMLILKKPLNQARPLTRQEVAALEDAVLFPESEILAVMSGFFLFCTLNCCRFTDAQYAERMELDDSGDIFVLHSGTRQHKTATTADKKTTLLPLVCLGHVFRSRPWAAEWLLMVEAQRWPETQELFLPAYCEQTGRWSTRRMTSGEGSLWLRECLESQSIDVLDNPKLPTTHSCKTTLLSWMAKAGGFSISERQVIPERFEQHRLSGTIHLIADSMKFACGRVRILNYLPAEVSSTLGAPLCEQCKSSNMGVALNIS